MDWFSDTSYQWAGLAFQRGLGFIYLIGFIVARNQFRALHGEVGLEPVTERLQRNSFKSSPSLFHFHYSDRFFGIVAWLGILLALAATTGISDMGPVWLSMLVWFVLWVLYLSILNVGGTFYGFGWESKLLDAGFLAIFMGPTWMAKPIVLIYLIRWLLFRVEIGAGLIKIRGDRCWRDLTCMRYHHETQPIPNPLSWYFHKSSAKVHKIETFGNHVVQLGVVWLIFAPQPIASIAGALVILSQLWLVQSGNYSWLNFLTIVIALPTLGDGPIQSVLGVAPPQAAPVPLWLQVTSYVVAALILVLSIQPVRNLCSRRQLMNYSFNPFHICNTYGAFGSVTRERHEIIIEGAQDANPSEDADWREYEMKAKPGDPTRRPRQIAPYHLRLDWQLWFIPLRPFGHPRWFITFVRKLLDNDPQTLALIGKTPFSDSPPQWIRVSLYRYRFSTRQERRESGMWWKREYLGEYLPPVSRSKLDRLLDRPVLVRSSMTERE